MREIKFRGYSKKYNEMFLNETWESASDGMVKVCNQYIKDHKIDSIPVERGLFIPIYDKDMKLMQYTGIKDDEEREIYEGDVIKFTWEEDSCWGKAGIYKGYIRFGKGVFEVVYIGREKITKYADGGWHENSESDDISSLMSWSEDIEVIGNIYENPELLEVEKC